MLEIIEVPVPRPRSVDQFLSGPFLGTKARLEELIHLGSELRHVELPVVGGRDALGF